MTSPNSSKPPLSPCLGFPENASYLSIASNPIHSSSHTFHVLMTSSFTHRSIHPIHSPAHKATTSKPQTQNLKVKLKEMNLTLPCKMRGGCFSWFFFPVPACPCLLLSLDNPATRGGGGGGATNGCEERDQASIDAFQDSQRRRTCLWTPSDPP
jgi:hypothetical protein